MLSIIIATKNESRNIHECLNSCAFADEVIVLDSGSTDGTVEIAKSLGARVIETDWQGYGPQQNRGIAAASHEWIYSLDADERISSALAIEIQTAMTETRFKVFDVPRKSLFVTQFMNHSGWWPDKTKRLFKKGYANFTDHEIHAHLETQEEVGHLQNHMIHYSYRTLDSVIEKLNRYSAGSARDLRNQGKRGSLKKAIFHALWAFFRTYIIRAGFLDGKFGFILAIVNAETAYYKYLKLMLITEETDSLNNKLDKH